MSIEEDFSKKPKDSQFHQQTLQAWKPFILMSNVFPYFAGVGTAFILIGVLLLMLSLSVKELTIDYTNCIRSNVFYNSNDTCSSFINVNATSHFDKCVCSVPFQLSERFNGQVYLYYAIKNLYQNHRRYVKSKDDYQLSGRLVKKVTTDCDPYGSVTNGSQVDNYAPCGIIANSLFNDTFTLDYLSNGTSYRVPMTSKGIAWTVDTSVLYGRPDNWNNTLKPINWDKTALARNNNSYQGDEELLVWMRTAPFPIFKKLHRIIQHDEAPFQGGLPVGRYLLTIDYAYPVSIFEGRKSVVLSTTSGMGGKNNFMGIMYIAVGSIQIMIAIAFAVSVYIRRDKKTSYSDMPLIARHSSQEHYGISD